MKKLNQYDPLEIIDMSNTETMIRVKSEFIEAIQDLSKDSEYRFGMPIETRITGTKAELNNSLWETADQYIKNEIAFSEGI